MERIILHCDLNCFYASVEMAENPELRKIPIAVGGDAEKRHGIILAKNYPAKAYGIKTGETLNAAYDKCPSLTIIKPRFKQYIKYSRMVKKIFYDYTDKIESFGIDEAWLDITHSIKLFNSYEAIAFEIKERIKRELGLTLSIGIGNNKIYAKLGSDLAGENEIVTLFNHEKEKKVFPLPVNDLLYVGKSTYSRLQLMGINTIGELATTDIDFLKHHFGKGGEILWVFANGLDTSEVAQSDYEATVKSVGNSTTAVRDLQNFDDVRIIFTVLADSVAARLREQGLYAKCISISVRTNKLKWSSAQITLNQATDVSVTILETALKLFKKNYDFKIPLRSLGIKASSLTDCLKTRQYSLFEDNEQYDEKAKILESTMDSIRSRFGHASISNLRVLCDPELSGFDPKNDHTIHPEAYFRK